MLWATWITVTCNASSAERGTHGNDNKWWKGFIVQRFQNAGNPFVFPSTSIFPPLPWLGIRKQPSYSIAGSHHGNVLVPIVLRIQAKTRTSINSSIPIHPPDRNSQMLHYTPPAGTDEPEDLYRKEGGTQTKHKSHCNCSHSQFYELMLAKTSYYFQLSLLVKNTGTVNTASRTLQIVQTSHPWV